MYFGIFSFVLFISTVLLLFLFFSVLLTPHPAPRPRTPHPAPRPLVFGTIQIRQIKSEFAGACSELFRPKTEKLE